MVSGNQMDRRRRQVERLLRFPGVGALPGPAIASNLGVPPGSLDDIIKGLEDDGLVMRLDDGRLAAREPGERA